MGNILIASFDLEVGGVERSLISMLNNFNYADYHVDVMLYSHTGDFMGQLPGQPNLLKESDIYKTFRMSIKDIFKSGHLTIGLARLLAKYKALRNQGSETGYKQMQYMWRYALPFLPKLEAAYDVAISYLWPHYFVAEKVKAKVKIAWIHTDFSVVETDETADISMWMKFDYIIAVSKECKKAFINKYPILKKKVTVIENITSPDLIQALAAEKLENPMIYDNRFKIITVARLSHAKGIDNAVRALKLLKERGYHNLAWYVVGYGGDEEMIRSLISDYKLQDNFYLLGKKINPYPYMKEADLYVQPSRYEGKAVTGSEAQILAKPVLITNYSTAKSQIMEGYDGMICELSVDGLADGIEELYHSLKLRKKLAYHCSMSNFNNSTHELSKLYDLIISSC